MTLTDGCESRFQVGNILGQSLTLVFLATSVMASSWLVHKREDNSTTCADKAQSLALIFLDLSSNPLFKAKSKLLLFQINS